MIEYLNLFDIKAESWSRQLRIDASLQTIHRITKLYNDKKSDAEIVSDYLQLHNILLNLYQHYQQLLTQIHSTYYGFLSRFFHINRLKNTYSSLAKFYLRLRNEAIWLVHKFALLLTTRAEKYYFFGLQSDNVIAEFKATELASQQISNIRQAYDSLKEIFILQLNFLPRYKSFNSTLLQ